MKPCTPTLLSCTVSNFKFQFSLLINTILLLTPTFLSEKKSGRKTMLIKFDLNMPFMEIFAMGEMEVTTQFYNTRDKS